MSARLVPFPLEMGRGTRRVSHQGRRGGDAGRHVTEPTRHSFYFIPVIRMVGLGYVMNAPLTAPITANSAMAASFAPGRSPIEKSGLAVLWDSGGIFPLRVSRDRRIGEGVIGERRPAPGAPNSPWLEGWNLAREVFTNVPGRDLGRPNRAAVSCRGITSPPRSSPRRGSAWPKSTRSASGFSRGSTSSTC